MSLDELDPGDRMMVEGLYWWGPATLFRCPVDPDPANCDIALVGVPHASGNASTERDQHLGPRAVRHVSALQRRYHGAFGFSPVGGLPDQRPRATCRSRRRTTTRPASSGSRRSSPDRRGRDARPSRSAATTRSPVGIVQGLVGPHSKLTGGRKVGAASTSTRTSTPTSRSRTGSARRSRLRTGRATSSARDRSTRPGASRSASAATREPPTGCSRATTSATR